MKEYVSDVKEAYDHEKANNEQWYKDGFEDGKVEMIQKMVGKGLSLKEIANIAELEISEIKEILNIKK